MGQKLAEIVKRRIKEQKEEFKKTYVPAWARFDAEQAKQIINERLNDISQGGKQ
ncbi:MAG: hypothetical protein ABIA67_05345 [Candidatus Margulisiibacteriota bacterium]